VIVEGWALGLRPQLESALEIRSTNSSATEDEDGRWRHWVNKQLRGYQPLWRKLDALVVLQAPELGSRASLAR
jgi:D-glycerate 3-kinase